MRKDKEKVLLSDFISVTGGDSNDTPSGTPPCNCPRSDWNMVKEQIL